MKLIKKIVYTPLNEGGTCEHCGRGIKYAYTVIFTDETRMLVGSTCIDKFFVNKAGQGMRIKEITEQIKSYYRDALMYKRNGDINSMNMYVRYIQELQQELSNMFDGEEIVTTKEKTKRKQPSKRVSFEQLHEMFINKYPNGELKKNGNTKIIVFDLTKDNTHHYSSCSNSEFIKRYL